MDDSSTIALIGTIDRALRDQGADPEMVSRSDKFLIAAQYVEMGAEREKQLMTPMEAGTVDDAVREPSPREL